MDEHKHPCVIPTVIIEYFCVFARERKPPKPTSVGFLGFFSISRGRDEQKEPLECGLEGSAEFLGWGYLALAFFGLPDPFLYLSGKASQISLMV
jgi:hypothetical protein